MLIYINSKQVAIITIFLIPIALKIISYTHKHQIPTTCSFFNQQFHIYAQCAACLNLVDSNFENTNIFNINFHNVDLKTNQQMIYNGKMLVYEQLQGIDYQCTQVNIVKDFYFSEDQSKNLLHELNFSKITHRDISNKNKLKLLLEKNKNTKGFMLRFRIQIPKISNIFITYQTITQSLQYRIILVLAGLLIPNLQIYYFLAFFPILKSIIQAYLVYQILRISDIIKSKHFNFAFSILYYIFLIYAKNIFLLMNLALGIFLALDNQKLNVIVSSSFLILSSNIEYIFSTEDMVWGSIILTFYLLKIEKQNQKQKQMQKSQNSNWQSITSQSI